MSLVRDSDSASSGSTTRRMSRSTSSSAPCSPCDVTQTTLGKCSSTLLLPVKYHHHQLAHFIYSPPLSVYLESPGVVVVLVPAPRGLDSAHLPLVAGQGPIQGVVQVQIYLTHSYRGVMKTVKIIIFT